MLRFALNPYCVGCMYLSLRAASLCCITDAYFVYVQLRGDVRLLFAIFCVSPCLKRLAVFASVMISGMHHFFHSVRSVDAAVSLDVFV